MSGTSAHPHHLPIASERIQVGHKTFYIDLKENHLGRYLKITESSTVRRDTLLIPMELATSFLEVLTRLSQENI